MFSYISNNTYHPISLICNLNICQGYRVFGDDIGTTFIYPFSGFSGGGRNMLLPTVSVEIERVAQEILRLLIICTLALH